MLHNCRALVYQFSSLEARRELEPKCIPQVFLGSLLMTRRSAIRQFFSQSLETVPEVFAKVNSSSFLLVGLCRAYKPADKFDFCTRRD